MGKFEFDLVKGKTIFLASLPFFSFEKQTKEHILFQAQPSKKKKKQSTLSKAKLIATFQSKILGLGSLNNLAQLAECLIVFLSKITPPYCKLLMRC